MIYVILVMCQFDGCTIRERGFRQFEPSALCKKPAHDRVFADREFVPRWQRDLMMVAIKQLVRHKHILAWTKAANIS